MDVSDQQLRSYSHAQLLKYIFEFRKDIRKKENLDSYKSLNIRNRQLQNYRQHYEYDYPYSTSWFDIPEELREMVINEIDPETVFQFKQCSKLCAEEAGRSKNSMYKIEINYTEEGTHISFYLTENSECPHFRYSFSESGWSKWKKTIICHERIKIEDWSQREFNSFMYNLDEDDEESSEHSYINTLKEEKWEVEESEGMKSVIVKYLKKFLEEYKYSLKAFDNTEKLDLKHLKNLQHIEFDNCDVLEENLMTFEQILKCREHISLRRTKLTFDQIIQLNAHFIDIAARDLTNEQIKRYLKMWENGEIDENIGDITIDTDKLKILDEEYYIDGLLTVFEREEPAKKRFRSSYESNHFTFKIKGPQQCEIHIRLADGKIRLDRFSKELLDRIHSSR